MNARFADQLMWLAFGAWIVACAQPAIGMLVQFALIICCVTLCDVKVIPSLMLLMLTQGNIGVFRSDYMALRLGVTISSGSMLIIACFFSVILKLVQGHYESRTVCWFFIWFSSLIPALIMSFTAKGYNLVGMWSYPILDALIPGLYFWSVAAGQTYDEGREYLCRRLLLIITMTSIFRIKRMISIWSFMIFPLMLCFFSYFHFVKNRNRRVGIEKILALLGMLAGVYVTVFGRADELKATEGYVVDADKYGSTFTSMGTIAVTILFAYCLGRRLWGNGFIRFLPIGIVAANALFVMFVLNTQAGDDAKTINWQAETMDERITAKVFGDRAGVWKMGWEEVTTPPYFIKDLRQFYVFNSEKGWSMKLLPHNQFITLLGRDGLWLGGILSIWIIVVWMRALVACARGSRDDPMRWIYLPAGLAIFTVVGVSGQSVVTGAPWANALVCVMLPGVAYGDMLARQRWQRQWWPA